MANIPAVQGRRIFTQTLIDVYRERPSVKGFLRSFFANRETSSKYVSIEVERGTEKIAVDVRRGTEGNRNEMSQFSQKTFQPPYYREYFDATDLWFYDQLFGNGDLEMDEMKFNDWVQEVSERLGLLQDKIERAQEKQCADVLLNGVITLVNGDNIDFKRKAGSMVDLGGGNYWTDAINPVDSIGAGAKWLRQNGKAQGSVFNLIVGEASLNALLDNTAFQDRANLRRVNVVDIGLPQPQADAIGSTFHGQFSTGSYLVNLWTYPEYYDNAGDVSTPYIPDNQSILLPSNPRFRMAFGAVPKIIRDTGNAEFPMLLRQQRGAFVIGNYIEERTEEHVFDIKSAPVAVPVAVDQIYTIQSLA